MPDRPLTPEERMVQERAPQNRDRTAVQGTGETLQGGSTIGASKIDRRGPRFGFTDEQFQRAQADALRGR